VSQKMGIQINIQKRECQFLEDENKKFRLEVEGQELEQTENFVYLRGTISTQELLPVISKSVACRRMRSWRK